MDGIDHPHLEGDDQSDAGPDRHAPRNPQSEGGKQGVGEGVEDAVPHVPLREGLLPVEVDDPGRVLKNLPSGLNT